MEYPSATLRAARQVLSGKMADIQHLMRGDEPAAWDQIRAFAQEMEEAGKLAHIELAFYRQSEGHIPMLNHEEEEAMDELEARHIDSAHVDPHFIPFLASISPKV